MQTTPGAERPAPDSADDLSEYEYEYDENETEVRLEIDFMRFHI